MERLVLAERLVKRLALEVGSVTVLEERLALEADHLGLIPNTQLASHLYPEAREADPLWLGH